MSGRFALLGDPVDHSISPPIYRAAFAVWGIRAQYDARRVSDGAVEATMRSEELTGGNVTLPHKLRAASALDAPSPDTRATGACNCWWKTSDGELAGDNTDVAGLDVALEELGVTRAGARVLVLGAGGAARAAVRAMEVGGARVVEVLNRTAERARRLALEVGGGVARPIERSDVEGRYDLVVNATSLGLGVDDPFPLPLGGIEFGSAFDMVYGHGGTRWIRHARAVGRPAADGLTMLVHQAASSLRRWYPDREPPITAMRGAAERALTDGDR